MASDISLNPKVPLSHPSLSGSILNFPNTLSSFLTGHFASVTEATTSCHCLAQKVGEERGSSQACAGRRDGLCTSLVVLCAYFPLETRLHVVLGLRSTFSSMLQLLQDP